MWNRMMEYMDDRVNVLGCKDFLKVLFYQKKTKNKSINKLEILFVFQ